MARPRTIWPDEPTLWDLAYLGCSNREIAQAVDCHPSLFSKRPDLANILSFARADRAVAIERLWRTHPAGDMRSPGRADDLVELVAVAERRSIQRAVTHGDRVRALGASTGESTERANEMSGIKNGE